MKTRNREKMEEWMKWKWGRRSHGNSNKRRSMRFPSVILYLYPRNTPSQHPLQGQNEEYVVLAPRGHNSNSNENDNDSCVEIAMPLLTYICSGRVESCPKTCHLKPLDKSRKPVTRTFHLLKRTVPGTKGGCCYNLRSVNVPDCVQEHEKNNHVLSNLGGFAEETEHYATIAVNDVNALKEYGFKGTYDLVECGPIAIGHISADLIVLHFNFKARNIEDNDASVETFFAELTQTNKNVVTPVFTHCLGPTSSLPDKAKTYGCLYCSSHNIHHPPDKSCSDCFHNGREYHWTTLESQTNKLRHFIRKSKTEGFIPKFSHPGLKYFGRCHIRTRTADATVALSLFNSETEGANFKLVKLRFSKIRDTSCGILVHLNFEAKNKDDPNAPIQTFFAEVINCYAYIFAVCCKRLGPSDFILTNEPENHGCTICERVRIYHPPGPGYVNGRGYFED